MGCGKDISDRSSNAKRCEPCGTAHKLEYDRIYNRGVRPNGLQPHKKSVAGRAEGRIQAVHLLQKPVQTDFDPDASLSGVLVGRRRG